jgi:hypothetical protein
MPNQCIYPTAGDKVRVNIELQAWVPDCNVNLINHESLLRIRLEHVGQADGNALS